MNARKGASLVDLIISLGIIALLFGGIVLVYFALTDAVRNVEARKVHEDDPSEEKGDDT